MKAKTTTISAQVFSNTTGFIKKKGNIYTSLKEKKNCTDIEYNNI